MSSRPYDPPSGMESPIKINVTHTQELEWTDKDFDMCENCGVDSAAAPHSCPERSTDTLQKDGGKLAGCNCCESCTALCKPACCLSGGVLDSDGNACHSSGCSELNQGEKI